MAKGDSLLAGFNVKGHYRTSSLMTLPSALAAGARLLTMRNTGTNLLIPTRATIRAVQAAAGTAQLAAIGFYRVTAFTASDSTNATALTTLVMSTRQDMAAAPGNAELVFNAASVNGMTGGTLTRDTQPISVLPIAVAATAQPFIWQSEVFAELANGSHPLVLKQNEGIDIENLLVNTTSFGVTLAIDLAWAEVVSYGQ